MTQAEIQNFWNEVGSAKNFTDPFFENKFSSYLHRGSQIIEYGCGYGRILNKLWQTGYRELIGFDFAPKMIERGKNIFPHLSLQLINESGRIPLEDQSVDAVILSTVLCCNPEKSSQEEIINEIYRLLKKEGVLYLCDFLITRSEKYLSRYDKYVTPNNEDYGAYWTSENVKVRHHTIHWIFDILKKFDVQWLEQLDDITMNGNAVRTFHLIARKV